MLTRRNVPGVHVQGHASQEELKLMLRLVKPRYFVPIHGEYRMLVAHAELAEQVGVDPENIFVMEDGEVLELDDSGADVVEVVPAGHVYVDGLRMWDVRSPVLRDRRTLSRDGFVVVVVPVDKASGEVYGEPEIVSSGFVDPEEGGSLMERRLRAGRRIAARPQSAALGGRLRRRPRPRGPRTVPLPGNAPPSHDRRPALGSLSSLRHTGRTRESGGCRISTLSP